VTGGNTFQWKVALILFGVLFLGVSDTQLVPPLLSTIAGQLSVTPGQAGIIVTSYSLAAAVFALFAGPLSDRIGRKRVLAGGLFLFTAASFATYQVTTLAGLTVVRTLTGFAAGTLSTCALSFAGDHYSYAQRGRAMGVLSMAYFLAFVISAPAGALMTPRWGWQSVFGTLAVFGAAMLVLALWKLPETARGSANPAFLTSFGSHFREPERVAGMAAAFLTSGGLVGYLTYVGAWLAQERQVAIERIALIFMLSGVAAVAASPFSGWLSDRAGKRNVIIGANLMLAPLFLIVARLDWGWPLWAGIAALGVAASARQAPLHALTTEIVGKEIRGEYTAVRNAASQVGIAAAAAVSARVFDASGFAGVSIVAAILTALIPVTCIWLKER
jgi:predicted MFS family arabinose efflux permease